jgi:hypothetical protein
VFHSTTSAAATIAGAVALHPVSSDRTAAAPHRDSDDARPAPSLRGSLPVIETVIPAKPAICGSFLFRAPVSNYNVW